MNVLRLDVQLRVTLSAMSHFSILNRDVLGPAVRGANELPHAIPIAGRAKMNGFVHVWAARSAKVTSEILEKASQKPRCDSH